LGSPQEGAAEASTPISTQTGPFSASARLARCRFLARRVAPDEFTTPGRIDPVWSALKVDLEAAAGMEGPAGSC